MRALDDRGLRTKQRMQTALAAVTHVLALLPLLLMLALVAVPFASKAAVTAAGDAGDDNVLGKALFEKRCTGCHSLDLDKEGPRLRGVYGRAAGTVPGFGYSDELKASHITWDETLLDKWLTDTDSVVPGNGMDFRVPKADERADIIAYLRSLSAK